MIIGLQFYCMSPLNIIPCLMFSKVPITGTVNGFKLDVDVELQRLVGHDDNNEVEMNNDNEQNEDYVDHMTTTSYTR